MHVDLSAALHHGDDLVHVAQIKLRIDALAVHVHGHDHDVHVAGALAVAQQSPLDTISASQHAQLGRRHPTTTIIVRMQTDDHRITLVDVTAEPLDLIRIDIRRCHLHGRRQVQDSGPLRRRLPDIDHRIAHFHRKLHFRSGEALWRIFESPLCPWSLGSRLHHRPRAIDGDTYNSGLVQLEYFVALHSGNRVVHMQNRLLDALQGIEGPLDQLRTSLGQHLNGHVIGNALLFHQITHEVEVRLRGGRETHLNLLEAHFQQQIEHRLLLGDRHRLDQRLITIAQIHAAPARRLGNDLIRPGAIRNRDGLEGFVLSMIKHDDSRTVFNAG